MQSVRVEPPLRRRDPAPSRAAYRAQRLWLTPLFRGFVRLGLPLGLMAWGVIWFLSDQARVDQLRLQVDEIWATVEERPEFMVRLMQVDGASDAVAQEIRDILPLDFPMTSFDLDLDQMRETVEQLDAVKSARLVVRQGGILELTVTERTPVILWRSETGLALLDDTGALVRAADARATYPDLPLIAGQGADRAVDEALTLLSLAGPISDRVLGLQRIGARRWDVVLIADQRILLPELGARAALERAVALHQAHDVLNRDISLLDLRDRDRPVVRLSEYAVSELRRFEVMSAESTGQ